jgi:hypothetical protein
VIEWIVQAVEGMEVQEESSYRVKLAIRTNAWRNRAMILLDGAVKPSLRYVSKSIKEVRRGRVARGMGSWGMVIDPDVLVWVQSMCCRCGCRVGPLWRLVVRCMS